MKLFFSNPATFFKWKLFSILLNEKQFDKEKLLKFPYMIIQFKNIKDLVYT